MATYTWNVGTGIAAFANDPIDWAPAGGPPGFGDTGVLTNGGTILMGNGQLSQNTLLLGNGRLIFAGDSSVGIVAGGTVAGPTFDSKSILTTNTGTGVATAGTIDAQGNFANEGTILAAGAAGSTLSINIGTTTVGTVVSPGYFYNTSTIQANAGNSVTINIGASSEMFNSGSVIANGGTVRILVSPSSIPGGYAAVSGFNVIQGGGTLETQASFPLIGANLPGGSSPRYAFLDSTPGNTLKIDNLGAFGGVMVGFQAGDTVDLGTNIAIGTIDFSTATGLMTLEAVGGAILGELFLSTNAMTNGATAVSGGIANGITVGSIIVNGTTDTVLTTGRVFPSSVNTSGAWQSSGSWTGGLIPGASDTAFIGAVAVAGTPVGNFVLNTGATPVSVAGISMFDPHTTLQITSNTTAIPGLVNVYNGSLEVTSGNTLTSSGLREFSAQNTVAIDAGGTVMLTGRPGTNLAATGGTLAIQQGNSSAIQITSGSLVVNGALLAGPGNPSGGGGGLTVIGSDANGLPASVTVNGDGIAGHGVVTDTRTLLGSGPTSGGSLILNGKGASWTDMIDPGDPLNSRGNMIVGFNDLSPNTPAGLAQPPAAMAANVLVENGATLTEQGTGATLGNNPNSAGNVTITSGALWNLAVNGVGAGIGVGRQGSGVLSVTNGGQVAIGANGTFLSNGTTSVFGGIGIGQQAGSTGTILVDGTNSRVTMLSGMSVGQAGQGLLTIQNGGTIVENVGGISVGTTAGAGSSGTIFVGGAGAAAALTLAGTAGTVAAAGGLTIGSISRGTVIVADNGSINVNGTGFVTVGSGAGSVGSLVVGGTTAAAALQIAVTGLTVGNAGTGAITVNALGTIALTGTGGIVVGQSAGASGAITVNGGIVTEGSSTTGLTVGQNSGATATVSVSNGGTLSLAGGGATVGSNTGASGTVTVAGAGAILKTTGTAGMTVGSSGSGLLTVGSGGAVQFTGTGGLNLGQNVGATGQLNVSGGTVSLASAGLTVGSSGAGTLAISGGGGVNVGANLNVGGGFGGSGTVSVNTGSILATGINVGISSGGSLTVSSGTVTAATTIAAGVSSGVTGTLTASGSGAVLSGNIGILIGEAGTGTLIAQNTATVRTLGNLSIGGSFSAPQGNNANRAAALTGGQILVTGGLAVWAGSTVTVDVAAGSGIDVGTSNTVTGGAITVESGHTLLGNGLIAAPVINNGLILASGSAAPNVFSGTTLEIQGSVSGSGTLQLGSNGFLRLDSAPATSEAIVFGVGSELILAGSSGNVTNAISGLSTGDKIEFNLGSGVSIANATASGGTVTVSTTGPGGPGSFQLTNVGFAPGSAQSFNWNSDFNNPGFSYIQVQAALFNWTGAVSTDFANAGNWQGNQTPNANIQASFGTNGGIVTGTGTAASLNTGDSSKATFGTWTFNNATLTVAGVPNASFQPFGFGFYENTILNGGTLNAAAGGAFISGLNGPTVTAQNGAQVTTLGDNVTSGSGTSGTLVVTGVGTKWTELTGPTINGQTPGGLVIGFSGPNGNQSGAAGYLAVTNSASLNTQGFAQFGGQLGGFGSGTLSGGANWSIGTGLIVGNGGVGTLGVTGATIADAGGLTIGQNTGGQGTVSIAGGGSLSAGANGVQVGFQGAGTLALTSGTVSTAGGFLVGFNAGGSGSVSVNGGSIGVGSNGVQIGGQGVGTLAIASGTFATSGNLNVGFSTGGSGAVSVASGTVSAAAGMQIGAQGSGALTVGTGGTLLFGGTFNAIGNNAGSSGTLLVTGGGIAKSTAAAGSGTVLQIGNNGTSSGNGAAVGSVLVTGAGSLLNLNNNGVSLGSGIARLTASAGGTINAGSTNSATNNALGAGFNVGSDAGITVTGTGVSGASTLNLTGFAQFGAGGSAAMTVSNNGIVNIKNAATGATGFQIGVGNASFGAVGGQAVVNVTTGGTIAGQSNITIGGAGSFGALNVSNGVVSTVSGFTVGLAAATNGTIYGGTGSVNILSGGTILVTEAAQSANFAVVIGNTNNTVTGPSALASGVVAVSGAGALLNTNGNPLTVGHNGNGVLTVSQGGSVAVGTPDSNAISALAVGRFGDGSLLITDVGSQLTSTGFVVFGREGGANVQIQNGASLIVNNDPTNTSVIVIGGGNGIVAAGAALQTGGSGNVQVTSNGEMFTQTGIIVGRNGAMGALSINTGGTVEAATTVQIGQSITLAAGNTISTLGGNTVLSGTSIVAGSGFVTVGKGGLLKADGGGIASAGTAAIAVGAGVLSMGELDAAGAGAKIDSNGFRITIGGAGQGGMRIAQGGTVLAATGFASDDSAFVVGDSAGASGSLTLSDAGSRLQATGQLSVGLNGQGALTILNGATATTGGNAVDTSEGFEIGQNSGASGFATVSGTTSLLTNAGRFVVGDAGTGSLSILGGGTVITTPGTVVGLAGLTIANTAAASGSAVNVSGAGSQLGIGGLLQVGGSGSGILQVNNGATATAATLDAAGIGGASGDVLLSGAGSNLTLTGSAIVGDLGAGVLSVLGGASFNATNLFAGAQGTGSGVVTVGGGGVLTITGGGSITLGNGASATGSLIVASGGTVIAGATKITGAGALKVGSNARLAGSVVTTAANETVSNLGTITGSVTLAGGDKVVTGAGASFAGGLFSSGGGNTLELASGPFALTGFNAPGSVQYSVLQIDSGVTVTSDASNHWGGVAVSIAGTLVNQATLSNSTTLTGNGALRNLAGDQVTSGVTATAAGETVSNLGTISGAVVLAGGDRIVTGTGAVFSGGINGGSGGNTLEIATGPFSLTGFNASGSVQYTTLQIDAGVIVSLDSSDVMTGVSLINLGTLNLGAFESKTPMENTGSITGQITLSGTGAPLINNAGGTISGSGLAVIQSTLGAGTIVNSGLIDPADIGVLLSAGGSFTNTAGATTEGNLIGVQIAGGAGTVTNAGTISGDAGTAVTLAAGFANLVSILPGAVFNGTVDGGNTIGAASVSKLELGSGTGAGALTGFGLNFVNFASIQIDQNATWAFAGVNGFAPGVAIADRGVLQLTGATASGGAVTIADTAGISALGTLNGGVWTALTQLTVGGLGAGAFTVSNGGTAGSAALDLAAGTGATGSVTVTGSLSSLSNAGAFIVGDAGVGGLSIAAGGTVSTSANAIVANTTAAGGSSIGLTGSGSNLQVGGTLTVGLSGSGLATVAQGSTVNALSLSLAALAGSQGIFTASGTGTSLGVTGGVTVGGLGVGQLYVASGASSTFGGTVADQGVISVAGGSASGGAVTIAGSSGITASGTVSGGTWSGMTQLIVGGAGSGSFVVNSAGNATTASIDMGGNTGGSGAISVSGTNSTLTDTGQFLVGDAAGGSLSILSGGTVSAQSGAIVANTTGASGSGVTISGAGSNLQVTGTLTVGNAGFGSLSISQSGKVTAGALTEAGSAGGGGVIAVSGTGSALALTGSLAVGAKASGGLSILGGATVTAGSASIGGIAGTSGNVDIEGVGSVFDAGTVLNIGGAGGKGVVTVGVGATLKASQTIAIGINGILNNLGGTIDPDVLPNASTSSDLGLQQVGVVVANQGTFTTANGTAIWNTPLIQGGTDAASVAQFADDVANGISSAAEFQINAGGTLILNADTVAADQVILFNSNTGTLIVGQQVVGGVGVNPTVAAGAPSVLPDFHGQIWGYKTNGAKILFNNLPLVSDRVVNTNTIELLGAGGSLLGSLAFFTAAGGTPASPFMNTVATQLVQCFAAGSRLETDRGAVAVEDLAAGDRIALAAGGFAPAVWIGRRTVDCARHPRPESVWPVRVRAGAFGPGAPGRDLFLSPDHAVFVDGVLVPVKLLANGGSIAQVERARVTYFHVELAEHAVILAEGLAVESYLDTGDKADFEGGASTRLFPAFGAGQMAAVWETMGAAPLVLAGAALERARAEVRDGENPPWKSLPLAG